MSFFKIQKLATRNPKAKNEEIANLEKEANVSFPEDYKALILEANGFTLDNGVFIYSTSEALERNSTFEVMKYAPGYWAIGDDGGGQSIVIALHQPGIYVADQGSMDPEYFDLVAEN